MAGEEGRRGVFMERVLAASDQARSVRARLGKAGQTTGFELLAPFLCGMHFGRANRRTPPPVPPGKTEILALLFGDRWAAQALVSGAARK